MSENTQVLLRRRPVGEPVEADFEVVRTAIPQPGPGEVWAHTRWPSTRLRQ